MTEKRRSRRRKDEYTGPGENEIEKPTKDEYKVAKWMKKNIKTKKTKFLNHNVEYFTSNKAIDALLKSKFATGNNPLFTTREQIIEFLDIMLEHKFYHRAKKVPVNLDELRGNTTKTTKKNGGDDNKQQTQKDDKTTSTSSTTSLSPSASTTTTTTTTTTATATTTITSSPKSNKKENQNKDKNIDEETDGGNATNGDDAVSGGGNVAAAGGGGNGGSGDKKDKPKRKIRLDMHPEQIFVDGSEAYVWIYDPIPIHYWIYGLILLLGAIGVCLFPLWPPIMRKGVYYLSVAGAGFLVFILVLTIIRLIIFTIVWAVTVGKLHFWIFPNLTEDVGFFASFWPLYESKYVEDDKSKNGKRSKSKGKKKDKDSDAEDDNAPDAIPIEPEKIEEIKEHDAEHDAEMELRRRHNSGGGSGDSSSKTVDKNDDAKQGDTEEEESQNSGSDNSEATADESDAKGVSRTPSESESEISDKFEIINSKEVQNVK